MRPACVPSPPGRGNRQRESRSRALLHKDLRTGRVLRWSNPICGTLPSHRGIGRQASPHPRGSVALSKQPADLNTLVRARLREAFGTPEPSIGRDDLWSIAPRPQASPIRVLLNGMRGRPAVWLLDPHDLATGVTGMAITNAREIELVIAQIKQRVRKAAAATTGGAEPPPAN
jgi:hypothetical protein